VNAHSDANPTGEVRGQIGQRVLLGDAGGAQEVPANAPTATGRAFVTHDPITCQVQGQHHARCPRVARPHSQIPRAPAAGFQVRPVRSE
jgi:hypothetical protein